MTDEERLERRRERQRYKDRFKINIKPPENVYKTVKLFCFENELSTNKFYTLAATHYLIENGYPLQQND